MQNGVGKTTYNYFNQNAGEKLENVYHCAHSPHCISWHSVLQMPSVWQGRVVLRDCCIPKEHNYRLRHNQEDGMLFVMLGKFRQMASSRGNITVLERCKTWIIFLH